MGKQTRPTEQDPEAGPAQSVWKIKRRKSHPTHGRSNAVNHIPSCSTGCLQNQSWFANPIVQVFKMWQESKGERAEQAALAQKERAREAAARAKAAVDAFKPLRVEQADSRLHTAWPVVVKHCIADFDPNKVGHWHTFLAQRCLSLKQW